MKAQQFEHAGFNSPKEVEVAKRTSRPQHPHDWWLHNVNLWRCAKCGGFVRSPSIPLPSAKATGAASLATPKEED